jgi:elongation factor Ts
MMTSCCQNRAAIDLKGDGMTITAKLVKELREKTGAGMMDCKKALVETDGDVSAAVEFLQKKGMAAAAKKAGRVAGEGRVAGWVSSEGTSAVLIEVNCETDFVSKNERFETFANELAAIIGQSDAVDVDSALTVSHEGISVSERIAEQISTIGEKIQLRRMTRVVQPEGIIGQYIHGGSQLGVLVDVRSDGGAEVGGVRQFARDIAMQVAAMNPFYLSEDEIPAADRAKQEEILSARALESGKPEKIIPRIVEGQLTKWRRESTLLDQPFIKDNDVTVAKLQDSIEGIRILKFIRFRVGEGIEKQEANLAAEVAELTGK